MRSYLIFQTGSEFPQIHYWKDKYEVDFIIRLNQTILPIEVKYANHIQQKELKGIINFCNQHQLETGIVITKDDFEQQMIDDTLTLYFIPALVFSLL